MSRFKDRKFDVICDSNGTNCWVPVEQAKALLCDAMALESENEVLRKKVEWLMKADRLVIWNGTEWQVRHQLDGKTRVAK